MSNKVHSSGLPIAGEARIGVPPPPPPQPPRRTVVDDPAPQSCSPPRATYWVLLVLSIVALFTMPYWICMSPGFKIESVSVSVSDQNATWRVAFSVANGDWFSHYDFQEIDVTIKEATWSRSAGAVVPGFGQGPSKTTLINSTVVMASSSSSRPDYNNATGPILISISIEFQAMFTAGLRSDVGAYYACKNLKVGFSSNATTPLQGVLLGRPVRCDPVIHG